MPRVPKQTTCHQLGCDNAKVNHSYFCIEHGGSRTIELSARRKALAAKYGSKQWKQFRQIHLSKYPLCARCQSLGKITPASDVDHIYPHKMQLDKWMGNRFQSLCRPCHSIKTALEKRGMAYDYTTGKVEEISHDEIT
jgi:5-methylcytosine-specific restriction protein A